MPAYVCIRRNGIQQTLTLVKLQQAFHPYEPRAKQHIQTFYDNADALLRAEQASGSILVVPSLLLLLTGSIANAQEKDTTEYMVSAMKMCDQLGLFGEARLKALSTAGGSNKVSRMYSHVAWGALSTSWYCMTHANQESGY